MDMWAPYRLAVQAKLPHATDSPIPDPKLRDAIYTVIPEEELREEISECNQLIRPRDDQSIDYFAKRYSYVRRFAKKLLTALDFHSNRKRKKTGKRENARDSLVFTLSRFPVFILFAT